MPFYLSPLVNVITNDDPSLFIPAVATSIGATVGDAMWGPIGESVGLSTEQDLFNYFGQPTNRNYKDWFTASNFLSYSNAMRFCRTANVTGNGVLPPVWQNDIALPGGYVVGNSVVPVLLSQVANPYRFKVQSTTGLAPHISGNVQPVWPAALGATVVDGDVTWVNIGPLNGRPTNASDVDNNADAEVFKVVKNSIDWDTIEGTRGTGCSGNWIAKYPGTYGNRISVAWRDGKAYTPAIWVASSAVVVGDERVPVLLTQPAKPYRFEAIAAAGNTGASEPVWPVALGATVVDGGVTWKNIGALQSSWENWAYSRSFPFKPVQEVGVRDEIAVVVFLDDVIVETFIMDAIEGRLDASGNFNYIGSNINRLSKYVWFNDERSLLGFITGVTDFHSPNYGRKVSLKSGLDGDKPTDDDYMLHWDTVFGDADTIDINLAMQGGASGLVGKYIIENIAERRKDCLAFVSYDETDIVGLTAATAVSNMLDKRTGNNVNNLNVSSSYGFNDGNYKYQYDRFNDKFRWLPLNGDMAGLAAATDNILDPWWSFGGYNRGKIKNVGKLAFNPTRIQRDDMYTQGINPVITTRGEGSILFGDRTMLNRPTAFRAVNVRRLFIVMAKAIATAAKYQLFEFNDDITRNRFVLLVTPFLRDIQSRRGIQLDNDSGPNRPGFLVVADERINTAEVIDRQEFKAKIFIRPNRSINFIELELVATKTSAVFEELIPQVTGQ